MQLINKDAELAVLGCCLLNNTCVSAAQRDGLKETDFCCGLNGRIFRAMCAISNRGDGLDYLSLEAELGQELVDKIGGPAVLSGLTDSVPSSANWSTYAGLVKTCSRARAARAAMDNAYSGIETCADAELDAVLGGLVCGVDAQIQTDEPNTSWIEDLERLQEHGDGGRIDTGRPEYDQYSPAPGEMLVIAGKTSTGKTAVALDICEGHAEAGGTVLYFSAEMTARAITTRRISRESGVPMNRMRIKGGMSKDDWAAVVAAAEKVRKRKIKVLDKYHSVWHIESMILHEWRNKESRPTLIAVDHLQVLRGTGESRYHQITNASHSFARMSTFTGLPTILLSQLNRSSGGGDDEPSMYGLRDSGAIEEDADIVWLLHRPDRFGDASKTMSVICAKNRNGPVGRVSLNFDPATGRFSTDRFQW